MCFTDNNIKEYMLTCNTGAGQETWSECSGYSTDDNKKHKDKSEKKGWHFHIISFSLL